MNKKIILSMKLPLIIENPAGKTATLELNKNENIVCKYSSGELYSLNDVDIKGWHPSNKFRNFLYRLKVLVS